MMITVEHFYLLSASEESVFVENPPRDTSTKLDSFVGSNFSNFGDRMLETLEKQNGLTSVMCKSLQKYFQENPPKS